MKGARTFIYLVAALAVALLTMLVLGGTRSSAQQMQVPESGDYNKFSHSSAYHARLPCALCHKREGNAASPEWPGKSNHSPCAGCHQKQFAANSGPICTICHSDSGSAALKRFPRLQSFKAKFDHSAHSRSLSCSGCHRPMRGGVALTIPNGANAHANCFRCHTPDAKSGERDIAGCVVCHEAGRPSRASQSARAFRVGFSHAQHNAGEGLACKQCHRITATRVTSPQPLNHHASARTLSCMSCHNGKRAFGGDDFGSCKRCHKGNTWHF